MSRITNPAVLKSDTFMLRVIAVIDALIFIGKTFSLQRLEQICDFINYDIQDLFKVTAESQRMLSELTEAQEQELVNNPKLMLMGLRLFNHYTFDDILRDYDITEPEGIQLLARLDRNP